MVGVKPIFGFLGMLIGLLYGLARGMHHGWSSLAVSLAACGFAGFIGGFIVAALIEAVGSGWARVSDDATQLSRGYGSIVRYVGLVIMILGITAGGIWLLHFLLHSLARMSREHAM